MTAMFERQSNRLLTQGLGGVGLRGFEFGVPSWVVAVWGFRTWGAVCVSGIRINKGFLLQEAVIASKQLVGRLFKCYGHKDA